VSIAVRDVEIQLHGVDCGFLVGGDDACLQCLANESFCLKVGRKD
jgi:hypothetical protein